MLLQDISIRTIQHRPPEGPECANTVKYPESVMVWGSFSGNNVRWGLFFLPKTITLAGANYLEVLEQQILPICTIPSVPHRYHTDIITIQETKLTPKVKTPKVHNFTTVCNDRLHKACGGLITLIRHNITVTTTDTSLTIHTHTTELQMIKVHINNSKHITIANIYIPPQDSTSTYLQNSRQTYSTSQTYH